MFRFIEIIFNEISFMFFLSCLVVIFCILFVFLYDIFVNVEFWNISLFMNIWIILCVICMG